MRGWVSGTFSTMRKSHGYEVYALLWVSHRCTDRIRDMLLHECEIPRQAIQPNLHLTVYHGRRRLPGLTPDSWAVHIVADSLETRFMVLAPGGENPRPELEPSRRSVGIRLTKRNQAIDQIQSLRDSIFRLETKNIIGSRRRTSAWTSCFGARHYQPHIKLLCPGSKIERDLKKLGEVFRSGINQIEFDRFQVRCGPVRR